jgi:hypothetical protein
MELAAIKVEGREWPGGTRAGRVTRHAGGLIFARFLLRLVGSSSSSSSPPDQAEEVSGSEVIVVGGTGGIGVSKSAKLDARSRVAAFSEPACDFAAARNPITFDVNSCRWASSSVGGLDRIDDRIECELALAEREGANDAVDSFEGGGFAAGGKDVIAVEVVEWGGRYLEPKAILAAPLSKRSDLNLGAGVFAPKNEVVVVAVVDPTAAAEGSSKGRGDAEIGPEDEDEPKVLDVMAGEGALAE